MMTKSVFPDKTLAVATVNKYIENVPGKKDVEEMNMPADVIRRQIKT